MGADWRLGFGMAIAAVALAGCADTGRDAAPETAMAPAPIVKREGVSLAAANVAVVSLEGAPDAAGQDFQQALAKQFEARGIVTAAPNKAHYLLRAYLAASPGEGGATLDYVVDVFDARRVRLARLGDGYNVKGAGDAWSLMSDTTLDAVAGHCADDLAAFLSNAPEAKPSLSYAN